MRRCYCWQDWPPCSSYPGVAQAQTGLDSSGTVEVPVDWSLVPEGLEVGDEFRLLFLSSTTRDATSTDISVYNGFVQGRAAAGHADVQGYSSLFRAVACTADVDATANTGTVGTGEPVYWLDGAKAADDYADFYDGSWDAEATFRNESGAAVAIGVGVFAGRVWTGCEDDGTEAMDSGTSRALGAEPSLTGWLNFPDLNGPLSANTENNVLLFPLYGLSPVFRVAERVEVPVDWSLVSRGAGGGR